MRETARPLRVAIVGAGPSGFYAAEALLKQQAVAVSIDLFDSLPTPYGLVRYGVAPDHQKIKSVTRLYERSCADLRLRFFGNVHFGQDLQHADLRQHYDAIIYSVGAPSDRNLGVPGEDLAGSLAATHFVAWYNGHPHYADMAMKLEAEAVAVIGMGNVAVDVSRILAKSVDELRSTDIADHALEALAASHVRDIYMIGRRGPAQAKFTSKELRELGELANADIIIDPADLDLDPDSAASLENDPPSAKNVEILRSFAAKPQEGKPRRLHLRFLASPTEIIGSDKVEALKLEHNRLEKQASGYINAVGTGNYETLPVGMVLRSVGYRGSALPDVPFDERRAVIPNQQGRVLQQAGGEVVLGEYVAGWIKRGPSGVIGTNKADAMESVAMLLEDAPTLPRVADEAADPEAIEALLRQRAVDYIDFSAWQRLDAFESSQGQSQGRPRVKVTRIRDMLEHSRQR